MFKQIAIVSSLVFIFFVSVFVRQSNFNRMLSDHHEWLTAHSLLTMKIWNCNSIFNYNAQPIFTYPFKGDYGVTQLGSLKGLIDSHQKGYYASYPQFAFQLPYFIMQIFHGNISIVNLQIVNLFFGFLSALLLFLLVYKTLNVSPKLKLISALIAFCIYVFSSNNLWFLQNVWFADIAVQFFLIASIYFYYQYKINSKYLYIVLLCIFFMCITEWIGFLFSFCLALFELVDLVKQKKNPKFLILLVLVVVSSLLVITIQYLTIASFSDLLEFWKYRFMSRTFLPNQTFNEESFAINSYHSWVFLFQNYKLGYSYYMIWTVLLVLAVLIINLKSKLNVLHLIQVRRILLLMFLSIMLHHFFFFSFTVEHDFSLLKDSILLSLIGGMFAGLTLTLIDKKKFLFFQMLLLVSFIACTVLSINKYYIINSKNCYQPNIFIDVAKQVSLKSFNNDAVFIMYKGENTKWLETPQKYFYCNRNIQDVANFSEAIFFMKKFNHPKGIIFIDSCNSISRTIEINIKTIQP